MHLDLTLEHFTICFQSRSSNQYQVYFCGNENASREDRQVYPSFPFDIRLLENNLLLLWLLVIQDSVPIITSGCFSLII